MAAQLATGAYPTLNLCSHPISGLGSPPAGTITSAPCSTSGRALAVILVLEQDVSATTRLRLFRDVSLSVDEGQIVTVIDRNVAGKTALLIAVMGLLRAGWMVFQGSDLTKIDAEGRAERGLCLVPEKRAVFRHVGCRQSPARILQPARPFKNPANSGKRCKHWLLSQNFSCSTNLVSTWTLQHHRVATHGGRFHSAGRTECPRRA
jgi:hypothetical protein